MTSLRRKTSGGDRGERDNKDLKEESKVEGKTTQGKLKSGE